MLRHPLPGLSQYVHIAIYSLLYLRMWSLLFPLCKQPPEGKWAVWLHNVCFPFLSGNSIRRLQKCQTQINEYIKKNKLVPQFFYLVMNNFITHVFCQLSHRQTSFLTLYHPTSVTSPPSISSPFITFLIPLCALSSLPSYHFHCPAPISPAAKLTS